MDKKSVTIYDIAKEAEVSTATVSRVIAGNYPVSKETRMKVMEIIKKYDFQPNAIARSLSSKKTKILGFITPAITNPFFSQVFIEIEKYAHEKGYSVLLCNSLHDRDLESKYIRMLLEQQAEGIILLGGLINDSNPDPKRVEELKQILNKTKLIMINGKIKGVDCFSVRTDEGKGIEMIVDHLVDQGHKKIGIIGGIKGITTTDIKLNSFQESLEKHQLTYYPEWQIFSGYDISDGEKCIRELTYKNKDYPTAIIGINDMVAIGAVKECRKSIINDLSIVGFDNTHLSRTSFPELTTVSHPYDLLGKTVIEVMLSEKLYSYTNDIVLNPELIKRESTEKESK